MSPGPDWLGLAGALPAYARIAWWGLASPLAEKEPLVVVQAVVQSDEGILLTVRSDLRGWELPGGQVEESEDPEEALIREAREETGLEIEVERRVGDYVRTGFRPHTAKVYLCRVVGGALRISGETREVQWFRADALPTTLFAWYREPLADALASESAPVRREEHQGLDAIWAAMRIDLVMRASGDRAG
jgi:ADP-ribose pyrophosphatase YjhB (NUDIX family)